jgi:hypothetical protein
MSMANVRVSSICNGIAVWLAFALLGGCGEDSGKVAMPVNASTPPAATPQNSSTVALNSSGPFFPHGTHRVTGDVVLLGLGPAAAAGAWVSTWVQLANGNGYSYVWSHGGTYIVADEQGRWTSWADLPDAELTILTTHGGHQPCAAIIDSSSKEPVRLEVIPEEAFDTVEPPRPSNAKDPSLTGTVYEMTPEGRKPVSGAMIWIEHGFEIQTARALTGREGRYYVCNLPPEVMVYATKAGYVMANVSPVDTTKGIPLDIEIRREGK